MKRDFAYDDVHYSRLILNDITRQWFLGFEWRQSNFREDGRHLRLQAPKQRPYGIDATRARCLMEAFRDVGVHGTIKPTSPTNMVMDQWEQYGVTGMMVQVSNPDSAFLEAYKAAIRGHFRIRYTNEAGSNGPPFCPVGAARMMIARSKDALDL